MKAVFDPTKEDISTNIFHWLFGRYQFYRKLIGGIWRRSTEGIWWKIVTKPYEDIFEDRY